MSMKLLRPVYHGDLCVRVCLLCVYVYVCVLCVCVVCVLCVCCVRVYMYFCMRACLSAYIQARHLHVNVMGMPFYSSETLQLCCSQVFIATILFWSIVLPS